MAEYSFGGSLWRQGLSGLSTGLISGGVNQLFAGLNAQRQFNTWKKMQDYINDYNSPLKQVERLKQAGLNPGLMYSGNSGSSLSASVGAPSGGASTGVQSDPMALQRMQNETKVSDATANRDNAQAELFRSQKTGQDNTNRTFDEEFRARMKKIASETTNVDLQNQWQTLTNEILSATKEVEIQSKIESLNKLIAESKLTEEQIEQVRADVSLKAATVKLNEALARHADAQTWQIKELTPKQVALLLVEAERMNYDLDFDRKTREWAEAIVRYTAEDTYQLSELRENQRISQRIFNENSGKRLAMDWLNTGANVASAIGGANPVSVSHVYKH